MKAKRAVSSGGVIFRRVNKEIQVALARRGEGKIWCLPKGLIEKGENPEETAVREVEEETGLRGEIVDKIGQIDYWFYWKPEDTRYHKFVHFYLIEYRSGDVQNHDYEVEEVKWFPIDMAIDLLSYKTEIQIVKKAKEMLSKIR
ncbi:MAG: NUDIX hydrolase [Actinomycetota bacterium]|nr:NUDIX hydrolase [Actinomycetota bacterium]MDI6822724.1 NUDIX hydrolase [Actinomycetota bacterium]